MKILKAGILLLVFCLAAQVNAQEITEKTKKRFAKADKDANNEISKKEWAKFLEGKTNKKGEPKDADLMFLGTDRDGNGSISLEEFAKGMDWKLAEQRQKE